MSDILNQVRRTIERYRLLCANDIVFVALSGGADSVALLRCLCMLKDELGLDDVRAIHVNHGLRGDDADADEQFVRNLCAEWRVPLIVYRADVNSVAKKHHEGVEAAGRRVRYELFDQALSTVENGKVAVAHNADDHAETVLFHTIRGCGTDGLSGIPIMRDRIVRPLLHCSSKDIRAFCESEGIAYRFDKSNDDVTFSRNRIRHEILPAMRCINPKVEDALARLAHIAQTDRQYMDQQSRELLGRSCCEEGYDISILLSAHEALIRRALRMLVVRECGKEPDFIQVERLYNALKTGGYVNLPERTVAHIDGVFVRVSKPTNCVIDIDKAYFVGNEALFGSYSIRVHKICYKEYLEKTKIHKNLFNFCVSYDMIQHGVFLRSRCVGDSMRPFGRNCSKSLKKLFQEWKIPAGKRHDIPVLCNEQGRVLAVIGYGVDECAAVKETTMHIAWFDIEKRM